MSVVERSAGAGAQRDHKRAMSRRAFLRVAGMVAAGAMLSACAP